MKLLRNGFRAIVIVLPWFMKRRILSACYGYRIARSARIGLAWIFPEHLEMAENSRIGHLTVAIHLNRIKLDTFSSIGRSNWITGFPKGNRSHFSHIEDRNPELILGKHSAITKKHHLDCTERIEIGSFTTIAGYHSQLLTHSIDIEKGIQDAHPISIGNYCFIGTNVVMLGGSQLPDYCVLGAKSMLSQKIEASYSLVGGVPAKVVKSLPESSLYFTRTKGYVD